MKGGHLFKINPALDVDSLRERFAVTGRLQIVNWLEPRGAEQLLAELAQSDRWRMVLNGGSQVFEISRSDYQKLPVSERVEIEAAVYSAARDGFQFCYETIRVADDEASRLSSGTLLDQFASFQSSKGVVDLISFIAGTSEVEFADAQGTRYGAGDFLTSHDDAVSGKHRQLAYVLGLTHGWSAHWGGLLHFINPDGSIEDCFLPQFNALSLFAVGQRHCVSIVAPFSGQDRISVTGWFRTSAA